MRIVDLCCGAGGSAMGLHHAFPDAEIVGVDIRPQPRYPFAFVLGDALDFDLSGFDFVWASPPCQLYSHGTVNLDRGKYPDLISAIRSKVVGHGVPWIIENVNRAPVRPDAMLCGQMFGLRVLRHRYFESSFMLMSPAHVKHRGTLLEGDFIGVYHGKWLAGGQAGIKGRIPLELMRVEAWADAMGIDWMTKGELAEAIPPAYSRYLAQFIPCAGVVPKHELAAVWC